MSKPEVVGLPVLGADAVVPCCPPITAGELLAEDAEKTAAMSKALGDSVRLRLFLKVASHADGEAACAGSPAPESPSRPSPAA